MRLAKYVPFRTALQKQNCERGVYNFHLKSQVAQNNRPPYPKVAHNWLKVAPKYRLLVFQEDIIDPKPSALNPKPYQDAIDLASPASHGQGEPPPGNRLTDHKAHHSAVKLVL